MNETGTVGDSMNRTSTNGQGTDGGITNGDSVRRTSMSGESSECH